MRGSVLTAVGVAALAATMAAACGGDSSSPSSPTPTSTTAPTTGGSDPTIATITIGSNGAISPSTVTITRGGRVTFVNSHNQAHDMSSNPHPEHSDCPELNQVGFLSAGQSRTSGNLNTARTCGFHDHNQPSNTGLQGRIVIQ